MSKTVLIQVPPAPLGVTKIGDVVLVHGRPCRVPSAFVDAPEFAELKARYRRPRGVEGVTVSEVPDEVQTPEGGPPQRVRSVKRIKIGES